MFTCINAESGSTNVDQVSKVAADLVTDITLSLVQINQIDKSTVSNLIGIAVVFNISRRSVTFVIIEISPA